MKELQLLIKPVSSACNLACRYCFYMDEAGHRQVGDCGRMTEETAKIVIEKALAAAQTCVFGFQGGEPALAGLPFFEMFYAWVEKLKKPDQQVYYTLQTNGTLLDEAWMRFLKKTRTLVGLSMDGVRKTHDENRRGRDGEGTFSEVFDTAQRLKQEGIPFHILCVLTAETAARIEAIYRFFMRKGYLYQQYIPCLDPLGERRGKEPYSLTPALYEEALKKLFDLWYEDKVKGVPVYLRQFENYVDMLLGGQPEACSMYGQCSMQNVIESDGTVYPCDFYALDEYQMGNLTDPELTFEFLQQKANAMEKGSFFETAGKRDDRCPGCRWYPLCRGGCRRDCYRIDGREKNYYCEAFQGFFAYAESRLELLADVRSRGRI